MALPAVPLTALRVVAAFSTLLIVVAIRRESWPRIDARTGARHFLAAALLMANWATFIYGVASDQVVESSLGYFINPLLSVLIGVVVLGERLRRPAWVAVGLATIGVGIITVEIGRLPWIALVLAATFAFYGYLRKTSPLGSFDGLLIETAMMSGPGLGLLAYLGSQGELDPGGAVATAALFALGLATIAPLLLFASAAKLVPLWTLGLMQYLAPTLQFLLGVAVFGESLSVPRLVGFVVIWIGLVIFTSDTVRDARGLTDGYSPVLVTGSGR